VSKEACYAFSARRSSLFFFQFLNPVASGHLQRPLSPSHALPMYMVMCHLPVGVRPFVVGETPVFPPRDTWQSAREKKSQKPGYRQGKNTT
jgi:hypothetical protein